LGDNIASIVTKYCADIGQTLETNQKSQQDAVIYPFTTLLIPSSNVPIAQPIHFVLIPSRHTLTKPQIACFGTHMQPYFMCIFQPTYKQLKKILKKTYWFMPHGKMLYASPVHYTLKVLNSI